jgi:probable HAF family extracellular repeat protein
MPLSRCLPALVLSLLASTQAFAEPVYSSTEPLYSINFLPTGFTASAINNSGQIVGTYEGAAAIFGSSGMTSLASAAPGSYGLGINDHGSIVGAFDSPYSGNAFVYGAGGLTTLGPLLDERYVYSTALAINNAGTVIGLGQPFVGESQRAYVYDGATMRMIPTFGGDWSYARAINASGAVAGTATLAGPDFVNPDRHAFIDRGGAMQDLGTLGGLRSEAYDINDAGLVVGWSDLVATPFESSPAHPFLYRDGAMVDLGLLGGEDASAHALNNLGLVVGEADVISGDGWNLHGFLYLDGKMIDLNALVSGADGWEVVDAYDINDAGQILGHACRSGDCVDVRLDLVSAVPEPAHALLLLAGLPLVLRFRSRAQRRL